MTESLFLMQRYWPSDDSDVEQEESSFKLEKLFERAKKKKEELQNLKSTVPSILSGDTKDETVNYAHSNSSLKASKKRKLKNALDFKLSGSADPSDSVESFKTRKRTKKAKLQSSETTESPPLNGDFENEIVNSVHSGSPQKSSKKRKLKDALYFESSLSADPSESLELSETSRKKKKKKRKLSVDDVDIRKNKNVEFEIERVSPVRESHLHEKQIEIPDETSEKTQSEEIENADSNQTNAKFNFTAMSGEEAESFFEDDEVENDGPAFPIIKDMRSREDAEVTQILPEWLAKPKIIPIDMDGKISNISELNFLDERTKKSILAYGIQFLLPVQTAVIPWLLNSHLKRLSVSPSDLCVSAPTGSGKTLAFVVPIVQSLKTRVVSAIRALVVLPVGDLAVQVFKVFEAICKETDLQVMLVIGKKPFLQERSSLVRQTTRGYLSCADIIVCTPGRLMDHIDGTPGFNLQRLQYLVMDEADRMMDVIQKGFLRKVENAVYKKKDVSSCFCFNEDFTDSRVHSCSTPVCSFGRISEPPLQKLMFSATLSQDPEKLHELSLYRPILFTTVMDGLDTSKTVANTSSQDQFIGKYITPKTLTEYSVLCEGEIKPLITSYIVKERQFKRVLCFTQSIEHSHRLYLVLSNMHDFTVRELSSNLKAVQRKIVLQQFELGKIDILVCSDMMARGMDIDDVDCVISYDVPSFIKTYIHRIGRTARAGKDGVTFTLLEKHELYTFKKMLKSAGKGQPSKFKIEKSDLAPFENAFKNALNLSSKTIAEEKRTANISKRTFLKPKSFKKKQSSNSQNRTNNHLNDKHRRQSNS